MNVLVLGATGYAGMLLVRILAAHPHVTRVFASSTSKAGARVREGDVGIPEYLIERVEERYLPIERASRQAFDVVFSALPHGASALVCTPFLENSVVIDLSADFRFLSADRFERAYGTRPPAPDFQSRAVYGLTEWNRDQIAEASVVANPGCYPTATLLPLLPLANAQQITGPIAIHAMSGVSGAGKKERTNLLYAERTENAVAYSPGTSHRHRDEIQEQLEIRGCTHPALFTPHLVPIKQGMAVTTTVPVADPKTAANLIRARYESESFVTFTGNRPPEVRHVRATNRIEIGVHSEDGHVVLMSVIDNLWKGAAGQAVQNMNVRFGHEEQSGLLYPGDL